MRGLSSVYGTVTPSRINHVSISAPDLDASSRFYEELFGARRLPAPNFGNPVRWLAIGDLQLHLFQGDEEPPADQHFAIAVDDFEAVYERARELGAFQDDGLRRHHLFELPGDTLQLYLRDPAGNRVEVNAVGASALPPEIRRDVRPLADYYEQSAENLEARLFL
jgi:lactoylglutathione lyase